MKDKLLYFYDNNKTIVFLILAIIIVLIIGSLILLNNNNPVTYDDKTIQIEKIYLFGSNEITIKQDDEYIEPGYYAVSKSGEIQTDKVIVTPETMDTSIPGTYYIHYDVGNKSVSRKVIVVAKETVEDEEDNKFTLELLGDTMVTLDLGEPYEEAGYKAIDSVDGDITSKVLVSNNVDINTPGVYTITYEIENSSKEKLLKTRTIVVKNTKVSVDIQTNLTTNYTSQNIILTIEITGNNFSYIKYPDGTTSIDKVSNYTIKENGTYKFLIYDKNNNYFTKEIDIKEIDKIAPSGTCIVVNNNGKSEFLVNAQDNLSGISKYEYYGNNKLITSSNSESLQASTTYTSAYVNIYDKVGNTSKVTCEVKNSTSSSGTIVDSKYDYLEMHFIISGYNDDAILIRTGKATIMIDGGRKNASKNFLPYLKDLGIKDIDAIIGSHPHYNHIQSQADIIANYNVKHSYYTVDLNTCVSKKYCESKDVLYIKDAIKKNNIPMTVTKAGDVINIGDMTLYFIGPYTLDSSSKYRQNANSSIFILKYKDNTFMFTGDTGGTPFTLKKLKPYADKLGISMNVDMLKYPHHGNQSIDGDLAKAISPKYVVIPNYKYASSLNSTGYSRIKNTGAKIYQLATDGNVVLISDGKNITVKKNQSASSYKR